MRCRVCIPYGISAYSHGFLGPFQVQRQQAAEDFVVGHFGGVVGPAVGGGDGLVERLVGEGQPGGAGVVEVGQGALLQVGLVAGLGDRAFGEAGLFLFRGDDPVDPFGRVEPGFAQFVEAAGGGGDVGGDDLAGQARRRSLTGDRGGVARRQAGGEGEGFEGGGRGVARPVFERRCRGAATRVRGSGNAGCRRWCRRRGR